MSEAETLLAEQLTQAGIPFEREAEYLEIAKGRLMATPMGLGLDVPAPFRRTAWSSGTTSRGCTPRIAHAAGGRRDSGAV